MGGDRNGQIYVIDGMDYIVTTKEFRLEIILGTKWKAATEQIPGGFIRFLLLFYVLVTSEVITQQIPTCDSAHSWRLYNAASLGQQTASTITCCMLSHIILTLTQPVLALS